MIGLPYNARGLLGVRQENKKVTSAREKIIDFETSAYASAINYFLKPVLADMAPVEPIRRVPLS